MRIVA
jgi:ribonuclease HI